MAWTSMHFAAGMAGGAAIACTAALVARRGWRWTPAAMTLGGVWALVPDLPRLWREDFPWLPFAQALGSKDLERRLHAVGDVFFFHQRLDAQPHEYALHGLVAILVMYNAAMIGQWAMARRERRERSVLGRVGESGAPGRRAA